MEYLALTVDVQKNVESGHSNPINIQIYGYNKQTTLGVFQSAFRQLSDFLRLKCPTELRDGYIAQELILRIDLKKKTIKAIKTIEKKRSVD